ncbi:MAG: ribbon-helix-helix domain-containing protein [Thermomicrobiales bacterium]|mgnify:CR=1 FL=1
MVSTHRRRVHVVLPDSILQEVDAQVGPRGRSEFIQDAIEEKLNRLRRVEAFARVAGSIADGEIPEWETPESTAAWIREIRKDRDIVPVAEPATA